MKDTPMFSSEAAAADSKDGRWTLLHDAQAAAYAADGYARSTDRPALVLAQGTAEALELTSALVTSWGDKLPVVAVALVPKEEFSLVQGALSTVSRSLTILKGTGGAQEALAKAAEDAPREGPFAVLAAEGTIDVDGIGAAWETALQTAPRQTSAQTGCQKSDVAQVAALLRGFSRPVIVAGRGAIRSTDAQALSDLAQSLGAPVLLTSSATTMPAGRLAEYRRAFEGGALLPAGTMVWPKALAGADGVLALGTALSEVDWFGLKTLRLARGRLIRVADKPAAKEFGKPFVQADVPAFVRALVSELGNGRGQSSSISHWRKAGERWQKALAKVAGEGEKLSYIEPNFAAYQIVQNAPENALFTSEGGSCGMWLWTYLWLRPLVFPVQHGTIGVPIPMTAGIQAGQPGAPVWGIVGDGAFFYNAADLAASAKNGPRVYFVFNDSSWSAIRLGQTFMYSGRYVGTDIAQTDYAKIARAYGCETAACTTPGELLSALKQARQHKGEKPFVVDVRLRKDHVPYAGVNFVLAELDGATTSLAAQSAVGATLSLVRGRLTPRALRGLITVGR
ncbi:MAG: thiamine pyrophosphate-dependent enzyme [Bdellovibrionota bacterium]